MGIASPHPGHLMVPKPVSSFVTIAPNRSIVTLANHIAVVRAKWHNARFAKPFIAADDGIAAGEPTKCFNPVAVVMRAEALSRKEGHVGAVAFGRTGDPATGDFSRQYCC